MIFDGADVEQFQRFDRMGAFDLRDPDQRQPSKGDLVSVQVGMTPFCAVPVLDVVGDRAIIGLKLIGREMTVSLDALTLEDA